MTCFIVCIRCEVGVRLLSVAIQLSQLTFGRDHSSLADCTYVPGVRPSSRELGLLPGELSVHVLDWPSAVRKALTLNRLSSGLKEVEMFLSEKRKLPEDCQCRQSRPEVKGLLCPLLPVAELVGHPDLRVSVPRGAAACLHGVAVKSECV